MTPEEEIATNNIIQRYLWRVWADTAEDKWEKLRWREYQANLDLSEY